MSQTRASIAIEPEERHCFRYIKDGSHGVLGGEHNANAPMVTLDVLNETPNYFNNVEFMIWCQVLASDDLSADVKLSPHTLEKKRATRQSNNSPKLTHNTKPIQEIMKLITDESPTNENLRKYKFCLEEYRIAMCKNDDINEILEKKYNAYREINGPHILQDLAGRQREELNRKKGGKLKRKHEEICNQEYDVLKVYLMFTIFEVTPKNKQRKVIAKLISKSIMSLDPIHINTLCNPKVPVVGADTNNGTKVYLLLRDVKFDYKMQIREIDPITKNNCWFIEVDHSDKKPLNNAMSFIVPEFDCPNHGVDKRESIECLIKLVHGRSESNELPIIYTNQFTVSLIDLPDILNNPIDEITDSDTPETEKTFETDRALMIGHDLQSPYEHDAAPSISLSKNDNKYVVDDDDDEPQTIEYVELKMEAQDVVKDKENLFIILLELRDSLSDMSTDMEIEEIWNIFMDKNTCYMRRQNRNKNNSTLFHDAIRFDQFYELECILYTMKCVTKLTAIRKLIGSVRNSHGQTLLHLACQENKIDFISSLLGMRSEAFLVQDMQGDTPLHVAIKNIHTDIMEEFIESEVLANECELWTKILYIYNNSGKTVLHCATEINGLVFVNFLLEHCEKRKINAFDIRVLGNGYSLWHLACRVTKNMLELFFQFCIDATIYEDYAGYDAFGNYKGPTPVTSEEEDNDDDDENE